LQAHGQREVFEVIRAVGLEKSDLPAAVDQERRLAVGNELNGSGNPSRVRVFSGRYPVVERLDVFEAFAHFMPVSSVERRAASGDLRYCRCVDRELKQ
jgi:hypothetical protein